MSRRYCLPRRVEAQVTCSRSAAEAGLQAASGRSWRRLPEHLAAVQVQDLLSAPRNLRWALVGVSASGPRSSDGERAIVSSENAEEDRPRSGTLGARATAVRPHTSYAGLPGGVCRKRSPARSTPATTAASQRYIHLAGS
jgi:hypothetical protein